jgi:hypothetical protein
MHRRRFLQLAGRLGAMIGVPRLEAMSQPSVSGVKHKTAKSPHTLITSLDEGWLVAIDPKNAGREAAWFQAPQFAKPIGYELHN